MSKHNRSPSPDASTGATHISTPHGLIPIEQWQANQKRIRDSHRSVPRPVEPPPRPNRSDLEADLEEAQKHKARTAARLDKAQKALQRGRDLLEQSHHRLAELEAEQGRVNDGLAQRIRDWVAGGAEGAQPQAKKPSVSTMQAIQQARVDHNAATMALCDLEADKGKAQEADENALTDVRIAARAILVEDAIDAAVELDALEKRAADLWHRLWGFSFAAIPGDGSSPSEPLNLGPLVSKHLHAPPRSANRTNLPPSTRTERGQQEVARVRSRFDELIAGTKVVGKRKGEKMEPRPNVA